MLIRDIVLLVRKILRWGMHFPEGGSDSGRGSLENLGKLRVLRQENGNRKAEEGTLAILWMVSCVFELWGI